MISDGTIDVPFVLPLEVLPVNDDPVLSSYVGVTSFDEDTPLTLSGSDFSITDPDVDGGPSLHFDGIDDYVYVDNNFNLLPMSIQVSFKGDFSGAHKGIITTDTPSNFGQSIDVTNGKIGVEVQNGFYQSEIETSSDTWYNATAVFTDGNVKLYINGTFELLHLFSHLLHRLIDQSY